MSALGTRADAGLQLAELDRNAAAALAEQADRARGERERLAAAAETAADEAARAAARAESRVAEHEAALTQLSAQLATLTGRSEALERDYLDSLTTGGGAPGSPPSDATPGQPAPDQPAPNPNSPNPSPSASSSPPPSAPAPAPSSAAPAPSPPPVASGPQPNSAAVATAIAFARAQLGEPYQYGAAGPNAWDCSGLTMMAYSAAGYAIGGHGATAQYRRAEARGLLVPYSQALPGDLIFYSNGGSTGGSMYHVTMYLGAGQMIEAPSPGKPVRIVSVRSYDRIPVVARPSG